MENLKPNQRRAKYAITLIWIVLAVEILSLISGYLQYELLQNVANQIDFSIDNVEANDTREQWIGIAYTIAFIVSAVMFIQWFRRAYFNLHLKVSDLSYSESWAAACWFVPVLNLFRPYQIMVELYRETKAILIKNNLIGKEQLTTTYVGWWWVLWLISNLLGQFLFRYSMKAESLDELTASTIAGMIGNLIGIPLALMTIQVIRDYANLENLMHEIKDGEAATTA